MTTLPAVHGRVEAVVIGTSAGGVEALSVLLPALPVDLSVAIMIVLHVPRDRPSLLVSVLQPKCVVPLQEALDKQPLRPGNVDRAPPDYHLLVDAGPQLALSTDEPVHFSRPSIDVLFESASELYEERLLGILLTGASEDGAGGLDAIQRAGGITIVQEPSTAHVPIMVESALKRSPRHLVLSLEQIADVLRTLGTGHAH